MGLFSGGNSSSSSNTTNNTSTTDRRGVADNGGIIINTGGAGAVSLTDQGAVAAALDAGKDGFDRNAKTFSEVVGLARDVVRSSVDATVKTGAQLTDAYATSSGAISPTMIAVIVVGVVALLAFRKG